MNAKEKEQQEAIEYLRGQLHPGDTIYTILRHVSRSGMTRIIDPVIMTPDGPLSIAGWAAKTIDQPLDRDRWGVKMGGCGMDMGFALVYDIARVTFAGGFDCIGEGCPSNDHSNTLYPDRISGSMHHRDGGYALRARWL